MIFMATETERKFIVINDSYRQMAEMSALIEQGYLCREPERTVRVRIAGDKGYLTVKGITRGCSRDEFEYEVPLADARRMLELCAGRVLRKRRWYVPFGGRVWETDIYEGDLAGLAVAEVELPEAESAADLKLPPFVGEEVTGQPRYYNSNL